MISVHVITCYQGVKLQLINTDTGVCDHHAKMAHISLGSSVAGERYLGFSSRFVGLLFAYFNYLLESSGFRTCKFGGPQL